MAGLLGVLILLWVGPGVARADCLGPICCRGLGDSSTAIAQAEVVELEAGHVVIELLPGAIYCAGGVECSPADFPVDFVWGDQACPEACPECAGLSVGDLGLVGVDLETGCLERFLEVGADGVACNEPEPVEFVLENFLSPACATTTHAEGYYECNDSFESCAGCAHAGQGGGVLLVVVGLGLIRRKRTARSHG